MRGNLIRWTLSANQIFVDLRRFIRTGLSKAFREAQEIPDDSGRSFSAYVMLFKDGKQEDRFHLQADGNWELFRILVFTWIEEDAIGKPYEKLKYPSETYFVLNSETLALGFDRLLCHCIYWLYLRQVRSRLDG